MKKILIALSFAIIFILALSCSKDNLSKGTYISKTKDGILYLELQRGHDCIMFFQGGKQEDGYYSISKGEIDLMGHAAIKIDGTSRSWWFGGSLGHGTISGDSFRIQSQRLSSTKTEYHYLTFHKQ